VGGLLLGLAYEPFTELLAGWVPEGNSLQGIRQVFGPLQYQWVRWSLAGATLLALVGIWWVWPRAGTLQAYLRTGLALTGRALLDLLAQPAGVPRHRRWVFWAATGLLLAAKLVLAGVLPLTADEANVWLSFARRGVLLSACYAPIPSNHVLHTVQAATLEQLFHLGPTWAMRLPATLAGWAVALLAWRWCVQQAGLWRGAAVWAVLQTAYLPTLYTVHGRGYIWVLGATLVLVWGLHKALHGKLARRHIGWVGAATVVGGWAVPSYGLVAGWLLVGRVGVLATRGQFRRVGWPLLKGQAVATALLAVLYTPILLTSAGAIGAYSRNFYPENLLLGSGERWWQLFGYHAGQVAVVTGPVIEHWPWEALLLVGVGMGLLGWRGTRNTGRVAVTALVGCWVFTPLLLGVFPPEKTFVGLVWVAAWVVLAVVQHLPPTAHLNRAVVGLALLLVAHNLWYAPAQYRHGFGPDIAVHRVWHQLHAAPDHWHTVRTRNEVAYVVLQAHLLHRGWPVAVQYPAAESIAAGVLNVP
jgi:hypothetical protein